MTYAFAVGAGLVLDERLRGPQMLERAVSAAVQPVHLADQHLRLGRLPRSPAASAASTASVRSSGSLPSATLFNTRP